MKPEYDRDPPPHISSELIVFLKNVFPDHFDSTNIFRLKKTTINYSRMKGVWSASVTMITQKQSDPKAYSKKEDYVYTERNGQSGREMYWHS